MLHTRCEFTLNLKPVVERRTRPFRSVHYVEIILDLLCHCEVIPCTGLKIVRVQGNKATVDAFPFCHLYVEISQCWVAKVQSKDSHRRHELALGRKSNV
jgi:hypothetical protein